MTNQVKQISVTLPCLYIYFFQVLISIIFFILVTSIQPQFQTRLIAFSFCCINSTPQHFECRLACHCSNAKKILWSPHKPNLTPLSFKLQLPASLKKVEYVIADRKTLLFDFSAWKSRFVDKTEAASYHARY